ncbi:hypothetical protein [Halomarina oriensis]|uniref:Uncharacterized protein n=1 Tax=Halomarina oriensis TaxID=671145 RepID=A0A6B0GPR9_9EURY|nr:hypothetical protein [Halomarina oriensis]MWG34653.1 hypothetical protein [Halomarina oriensis]
MNADVDRTNIALAASAALVLVVGVLIEQYLLSATAAGICVLAIVLGSNGLEVRSSSWVRLGLFAVFLLAGVTLVSQRQAAFGSFLIVSSGSFVLVGRQPVLSWVTFSAGGFVGAVVGIVTSQLTVGIPLALVGAYSGYRLVSDWGEIARQRDTST